MKKLKIKKIILTTDYKTYAKIREKIESYGLKPLLFSCIKIKPVRFKIPNKKYDWIFFTSKNSVRHFLGGADRGFFKDKKIAAIGLATSKEIEETIGVKCDFIPPNYNSVSFCKYFASKYRDHKLNILFPSSNLVDDYLKNKFLRLGHDIDKIVVYKTIKPKHSDYRLKLLKRNIKGSLIIFSSPSSLSNFIDTCGLKLLKYPYIVAMGIKTEKALNRLGFKSFIRTKSDFESIILKIRNMAI